VRKTSPLQKKMGFIIRNRFECLQRFLRRGVVTLLLLRDSEQGIYTFSADQSSFLNSWGAE
jgi:hypothetical protein